MTVNILKYSINMDYLFQFDICEIDYFSRKQRFKVIYNLLSIRYNSHICVQITIGRWELEVWDMFGVSFINHPDLRCISTDYDFEGHS
uniref:NADH:ubiquinone oxidoreductase 30kDa subunit domain-containing protein n=1 Tax=Solanum lycopersicum TaxID=4081 RepID=A0A3Q7HCR9_SOLLC